MNITDHDYKPILDSLNLRSLESRKTVATLILPFKLINGLVSCPSLLKLLNSYASARTFRKVNKFLARRFTFKFRNFHPIYRMCSIIIFVSYRSFPPLLFARLNILRLNFCNVYSVRTL